MSGPTEPPVGGEPPDEEPPGAIPQPPTNPLEPPNPDKPLELPDPVEAEPRMEAADNVSLVRRASEGDLAAWNALVDHYSPLVHSIARRHRLSSADEDDVIQIVWLRLVEHISSIKNPDAIAAWIASTTSREILRMLRSARRPETVADLLDEDRSSGDPSAYEEISRAEHYAALYRALGQLPERQRQLLLLLLADPPLSYETISRRLSLPIGSIGPTRRRALAQLRHEIWRWEEEPSQ